MFESKYGCNYKSKQCKFYFSNNGYCRNGDKCTYKHDIELFEKNSGFNQIIVQCENFLGRFIIEDIKNHIIYQALQLNMKKKCM